MVCSPVHASIHSSCVDAALGPACGPHSCRPRSAWRRRGVHRRRCAGRRPRGPAQRALSSPLRPHRPQPPTPAGCDPNDGDAGQDGGQARRGGDDAGQDSGAGGAPGARMRGLVCVCVASHLHICVCSGTAPPCAPHPPSLPTQIADKVSAKSQDIMRQCVAGIAGGHIRWGLFLAGGRQRRRAGRGGPAVLCGRGCGTSRLCATAHLTASDAKCTSATTASKMHLSYFPSFILLNLPNTATWSTSAPPPVQSVLLTFV